MLLSKCTAVLLAGVVLVASPAAMAACATADLDGRWQWYATGWETGGLGWGSCDFRITLGRIANTTCTTSVGETWAVTNGTVTLSNAAHCTVTARFTVNGAVLYRMTDGTLSTSKNIGSGVGIVSGGGRFMVNFIKY